MKAFLLISSVLLFLQGAIKAQILDISDQRRIEQRRIFAREFYKYPQGSAAYCGAADELGFICAAEGKKDSAFYFLNETFSYEGNDTKVLLNIYDPYNLDKYPYMKWKNSKEWKAYEQKVTEKFMELSKALKQPKLTFDLLKAYGLDQSVRLYLMKIHHDTAAKADARKIDSANLVFIKQVVKKYGFPGLSMVGETAYEGAFLLCQHADDDLAFQKTVLEQLKKLAATGDAKKEDVAYLTDRIMVKEKGTQMYGTQFKNYVPYPIVDSANIDSRRAEMGLGSLEEYKKGFLGVGKPPGRN